VFPAGPRRSAVVVLAVLLIVGPVVPALGSPTAGIAAGAPDGVGNSAAAMSGGSIGIAPAATAPTDNDSIRHENPEEAGEDGNLNGVQDWLLERISSRLESSTRNISQGQYDAAAGYLDNETREYLSQYVDVAGETEDKNDDEIAERINDAIEQQRNFTRTRQNYSETYQEYLEARENGNIERARRLARQLAALERRLNRTGENLSRNYRQIGNATGSDTNEETQAINQSTENASEINAEIREELFDDTQVVITSMSERVSPTEPLVVHGRVLAANGTPVTEGVVQLRSGRGANASLNETGWFTLRHRPVLVPSGPEFLLLAYRPPASSVYLGSTGYVQTRVTAREPTLVVSGATEVGFGDDLNLTTELTIDGQPIEGVPIQARVDGLAVASAVSTNGTTILPGRVPAAADDGVRELRVTLPIEGRAVESVTVTREIRVRETDTQLDIDVTALSSDRVRVMGTLTTVDGRPVPDRALNVVIAGEEAGGATSNATGGFAVVLTVPEDVDADEFENRSVPVTASFASPATNLGAASAEDRVELPAGVLGEDGGLLGLGVPWWAWLALLVLSLAVAAVSYVVFARRERERAREEQPGVDTPAEAPTAVDGMTPDDGASAGGTSLLALAGEHLDAGDADAATQAGYAAVQEHLAAQLDAAPGTHWELYRACSEAELPSERIGAVRRLVESYERAAFAPNSVPIETAREALGAAREALGEGETRSGAD